MNTKNGTMVFATIALLGSTITVASILSIPSPSTVYASHEFVANLSGQQEVPPVDTQAIGEAILVPDLPGNQTINYYVNATGIQGATQGHIHSGAQGENGPVVASLFNFSSSQDEVGQKGYFTKSDLVGPMQGKNVSDLIDAMKSNSTYVNFHTEQNPDGEIRGQIVDIK
jgi:CHRD domain-containing protein